MGNRYLTELADWIREAGLVAIEMDGWQHNARGSGGYDADKPWCIMWHHTASDTDPENDANYIAFGHEDSPIANLLLDREGIVWVCAGGATNTNGKGGPVNVSRGTVPVDSMNTYAIGIEAANNGVGQPWPQEQIDAYFALSNKLAEKLGLQASDICHHSVWAIGRKIDPATAAAVQGPWRPGAENSSGSWSLLDTRTEAEVRWDGGLPPEPIPEPPEPLPEPNPTPPVPYPEDDDMRLVAAIDSNGTIWIGNGVHRRPLDSMDTFSNYVVLSTSGAQPMVNTSGQQVRELGHVATVGDFTIEALGEVLP